MINAELSLYYTDILESFRINEGDSLRDEVEKTIGEIRPRLQSDGGDIELVDVKDGVVKVKLTGACAGCPMAQMTLKMGVERYQKTKIPGVQRVDAV